MGQKGRVLELVLASDPNTTNTNWSSGPIELEEVSQQRATFNRVDIRFIYFIMCMYICISVCGFVHNSVVPAKTRKGHWIP